jgi:hypothetical protein
MRSVLLVLLCLICSPAFAIPSRLEPITCTYCSPCKCKMCDMALNKAITDKHGNEVYHARHPATWPSRPAAVKEGGWFFGPFRGIR